MFKEDLEVCQGVIENYHDSWFSMDICSLHPFLLNSMGAMKGQNFLKYPLIMCCDKNIIGYSKIPLL